MLANAPPPPQAAEEPLHPGPVIPKTHLPETETAPEVHRTYRSARTASHAAAELRAETASPSATEAQTLDSEASSEAGTDLPTISPKDLDPPPEESQPLSTLYDEKKTQGASAFMTPAYMIKLSGVLLVLLTLAFIVIKLMAKSTGASPEPLVPFRKGEGPVQDPLEPQDFDFPPAEKPDSWFASLFKPAHNKATQRLMPKIIARTKLGPTKEIHIVAVGQKRLVVGSTQQQMTLLTSWDEGLAENVAPTAPQAKPSGVHQKYLNPQPKAHPKAGDWITPNVPEVEEVVMLDDYEDQYPG